MSRLVFLGWNSISTKQGFMCVAQGHNKVKPVRQTHNPSFSSQAHYHWATALPLDSDLIEY